MTTTDARRPHRDLGATFIEMLVSIVLIGTTGIAVLTALAAATHGAKIHSDIADGQSWLANIGDLVNDEDSAYLSCVDQPDPLLIAAHYQSQIVDPATAATSAPPIVVTNVTHWNSASGAFETGCRYSLGDRLQLVTLETTVGAQTFELTVVKRPASIPPTVTFNPPPTTLGGGSVVPDPTPNL